MKIDMIINENDSLKPIAIELSLMPKRTAVGNLRGSATKSTLPLMVCPSAAALELQLPQPSSSVHDLFVCVCRAYIFIWFHMISYATIVESWNQPRSHGSSALQQGGKLCTLVDVFLLGTIIKPVFTCIHDCSNSLWTIVQSFPATNGYVLVHGYSLSGRIQVTMRPLLCFWPSKWLCMNMLCKKMAVYDIYQ